MVIKKAALAEALIGQFEDHHAFLCRTLLDSIDFLSAQIDALTVRTTQAVEELPCPDPSGGSRLGAGADLVAKLVTIPGVGVRTAQMLLAELGPDMTVFPTADHLVSWAKFAPRSPLQAHHQAPRPQESPGRRRPFTPGRRLAPAQRTRDSVHRPRLRLPPAPRRPHPPNPRPCPPAQSPRPRRHPHVGSLTSNPVQPLANDGRSLPWCGEIFRSGTVLPAQAGVSRPHERCPAQGCQCSFIGSRHV
ncbi:transposase [Streptomyces mirabilis]